MLDYEIQDDGRIEFRVNKKVYPLKAIYRAAYLFTDKYYIGLDQTEETYIIKFSGKEKTSDYDDVGAFQNELLNQNLKLALSNDTREIRELIVTRALYSSFLPEENEEVSISETSEQEYDLDEIAKAWYEE